MTNSKQHFRDLKEAEVQEWRRLPQTALLVESLSSDAQRGLENCANLIGGGGTDRQAAWQAGWAAYARVVAGWITERREDVQQREVIRG